MSVVAPLSKYRKHNLILIAIMLIGGAVWFWYDAQHNQTFITKHTNADGTPDSTLAFNQKSPPFLLVAGLIIAARFWMIKDKKVIADDKELRYEKQTIPYDRIQSIDKTYFESRGFFVIQYKDDNQQMMELKLHDKSYDNLATVLDYLTTKITG